MKLVIPLFLLMAENRLFQIGIIGIRAAIVEAYRAKAKDIATYSFGNNP